MDTIQTIKSRRILNSHVKFTNEFIILLKRGSIGIGSSPRGETISIYEGQPTIVSPEVIVDIIKNDNILNTPFNQTSFDNYLSSRFVQFGRRNVFALSVAFHNAINNGKAVCFGVNTETNQKNMPHLCINMLNGGMHAYTNPVASDFHEFLLVPKDSNFEEIIGEYEIMQHKIKELLACKEKIRIGNNIVNKIGSPSNRACLDFLQLILEMTNLAHKYELMIDAAATDLWDGKQYSYSVTGSPPKKPEEFYNYWLDIISDYDIRYLEDPFHEEDLTSWKSLVKGQSKCVIIGDDIHSGNSKRIQHFLSDEVMSGVMLKPDQAGTVSETINAIKTAHLYDIPVILSHRSISTESTFLPFMAHKYNVKHVKFGPMHTDYSSIIKINELIRLYG